MKTFKRQTIAFDEIGGEDFSIKNSEESKNKKTELHWKNIIPIPHFLTKAYLSLNKFDPGSVAEAFYIAMKEFDSIFKTNTGAPNLIDEDSLENSEENMTSGDKEVLGNSPKEDETSASVPTSCVSAFTHVLQFCHLCFIKKMPPVMYSVVSSPEVTRWFESVSTIVLRPSFPRAKRAKIHCGISAQMNQLTARSRKCLGKIRCL